MATESEKTVPPPPPPPGPSSSECKTPKTEFTPRTGTPDTDRMLEDIRNGVTLKPTKTRDRSTAAFIKKSNGPSTPEPPPSNGCKELPVDDMKDALQAELRNTLKRKVKKQDVERGDPTKNHAIEKTIEVSRTEVELKVNNGIPPPKPARALPNGKAETAELVKSPVMNRLPVKIETAATAVKSEPKVTVRPFESSTASLNGTLKKITPQKELKIDVSSAQADSLKNSILSPEVKSGSAAIRPSQIKTLTKQGSHVSHTDIVEDAKMVVKSPVSLVEKPAPLVSPPPSTPKQTEPYRSGQNAMKTPTRTTILDTKISYKPVHKTPVTPTKSTPNDPYKKLLISHPKASFTLPRSNSRQAKQPEPTGSKPVFRILTELEQIEQREGKKTAPKADEPGAEPVLNSYVSFAKDLSNAPNNYPDSVVTKTIAAGSVQEDVFFGSTNLRNIKIDIVENGQCKVVSK